MVASGSCLDEVPGDHGCSSPWPKQVLEALSLLYILGPGNVQSPQLEYTTAGIGRAIASQHEKLQNSYEQAVNAANKGFVYCANRGNALGLGAGH